MWNEEAMDYSRYFVLALRMEPRREPEDRDREAGQEVSISDPGIRLLTFIF